MFQQNLQPRPLTEISLTERQSSLNGSSACVQQSRRVNVEVARDSAVIDGPIPWHNEVESDELLNNELVIDSEGETRSVEMLGGRLNHGLDRAAG